MPDKSPYKVLQVDPAADPEVIRAAFRALASRLDPDRDITGVEEVRLAEIKRAYAVLSDPVRRREYDEQLANAAVLPMGPGHGPGADANGAGSLTDRLRTGDAEGLADTRIDFGRYQGWTLGELLRHDRDYLRWLSRHSSGIRYRGVILRLLAAEEAQRPPLRVSP